GVVTPERVDLEILVKSAGSVDPVDGEAPIIKGDCVRPRRACDDEGEQHSRLERVDHLVTLWPARSQGLRSRSCRPEQVSLFAHDRLLPRASLQRSAKWISAESTARFCAE